MTFAGFMGLLDPPRPEVPQALEELPQRRYQSHHDYRRCRATAAAIARDIGLITGDPVIIEGRDCADHAG